MPGLPVEIDQRASSICTATFTKVDTKTSQRSIMPTSAPSVVAVISSPEPTTAAEVIMPGPRNLRLGPQPFGGSRIFDGSSMYGSLWMTSSSGMSGCRCSGAVSVGSVGDNAITFSDAQLESSAPPWRPTCRHDRDRTALFYHDKRPIARATRQLISRSRKQPFSLGPIPRF